MNIEINNLTAEKIDKKYFQKIGEIVLKKIKQPVDTEISLAFVGDAEMKKWNKKYRGKNKTTDVLSFDYRDMKIPPNLPLENGGKFLFPFLREGWDRFVGEIVISIPQARKQAKQKGYPLKRELSELFVHGILHLSGYDDETQIGYSKMLKKQEEILNAFNN